MSVASEAQRLVDSAVNRHGRLDGAFNHTGISQGGAAMADVSEETFDRLLAVNLKGGWLAMRARSRRCSPRAPRARSSTPAASEACAAVSD